MKTFNLLALTILFWMPSWLFASSDYESNYDSINSVRTCACQCDSMVGFLCPAQLKEKGICEDSDFRFQEVKENECKNLKDSACKGYSRLATGVMIRGRFSNCEMVAEGKPDSR